MSVCDAAVLGGWLVCWTAGDRLGDRYAKAVDQLLTQAFQFLAKCWTQCLSLHSVILIN